MDWNSTIFTEYYHVIVFIVTWLAYSTLSIVISNLRSLKRCVFELVPHRPFCFDLHRLLRNRILDPDWCLFGSFYVRLFDLVHIILFKDAVIAEICEKVVIINVLFIVLIEIFDEDRRILRIDRLVVLLHIPWMNTDFAAFDHFSYFHDSVIH